MQRFFAKKRHFLKLAASYLLIAAIITTGLCLLLYYYLYQALRNDNLRNAQEALSHTSYIADVLYEQVTQIGSSLLSDLNVAGILEQHESRPIEEYGVYLDIKRLQAIYPFIQDVMIVNIDSKKLLSSEYGTAFSGSDEIISLLRPHISIQNFFSSLSLPRWRQDGDPMEYSNSLAFFYYRSRISGIREAVVVCVKEEYLRGLIQEATVNPSARIFILDSEGLIISHADKTLLGLPPAEDAPVSARALQSSKMQDSFITKRNGRRESASYVKNDLLGWIFVSVTDYSEDMLPIQSLLNALFLSSALLFAAMAGLSAFTARRMFIPVNAAMNSLEQRLHEALPSISGMQLHMAISGLPPRFPDLLNDFNKRFFFALAWKIDAETEGGNEKDDGLCRYAASNVLEEILCKEGAAASVPYSEIMITLFSTDKGLLAQDVAMYAESALDWFSRHFNRSFTCAVGDRVDDAGRLSDARQSAMDLLRNEFMLGQDIIICRSLIEKKLSSKSPMERGLPEAIISYVRNMILPKEQLRSFMLSLSDKPINVCLFHLQSLVQLLLLEFERECESALKENPRLQFLAIDPERLSSFAEAGRNLTLLCEKIINASQLRVEAKNQDAVLRVKEYILDRYKDPGLCTESVAEACGLSAGYLRKMFKGAVGAGVSEYIMDVRLEAAKDLLLTTDKTATAICEEIGMNSNAYFTTLFKKKFGLTPILFRQSRIERKEK
ncbi:MAG: helix-turn-helix domain-containing protein [Clostridiales bacterium]|jgi:AraC-like DNA-binding protein|nr:helix-turn-helix domain-containing protein [Clostridiales bacterium]